MPHEFVLRENLGTGFSYDEVGDKINVDTGGGTPSVGGDVIKVDAIVAVTSSVTAVDAALLDSYFGPGATAGLAGVAGERIYFMSSSPTWVGDGVYEVDSGGNLVMIPELSRHADAAYISGYGVNPATAGGAPPLSLPAEADLLRVNMNPGTGTLFVSWYPTFQTAPVVSALYPPEFLQTIDASNNIIYSTNVQVSGVIPAGAELSGMSAAQPGTVVRIANPAAGGPVPVSFFGASVGSVAAGAVGMFQLVQGSWVQVI